MQRININKHKRQLFTPLIESAQVQAAVMVLNPGQSSSEKPENEHPAAEQWLLVLAGAGAATVGDRHLDLEAGSLLLVEQGEPHQITNTGSEPLLTINFYSPPAYTTDGEVRPSVQSGPQRR